MLPRVEMTRMFMTVTFDGGYICLKFGA